MEENIVNCSNEEMNEYFTCVERAFEEIFDDEGNFIADVRSKEEEKAYKKIKKFYSKLAVRIFKTCKEFNKLVDDLSDLDITEEANPDGIAIRIVSKAAKDVLDSYDDEYGEVLIKIIRILKEMLMDEKTMTLVVNADSIIDEEHAEIV